MNRPHILVNGDATGHVAAGERGLSYGDGLFETLAVRNGRPQLWERHMARLQAGCERLSITPVAPALLADEAGQVTGSAARAVLKITVTRGAGARGYRPHADAVPTRIVQCLPDPDYPPACARTGIAVRLCAMRMGHNPRLAGIKHLNRLEQVLARGEWNDDNIHEGLLADQAGNLVAGTMSNVFLVQGDTLLTPGLVRCGVAGVMRELLLELAGRAGIASAVRDVALEELQYADEMFVCNSLIGIWPVSRCAGRACAVGEVTRTLQRLLGEALENER